MLRTDLVAGATVAAVAITLTPLAAGDSSRYAALAGLLAVMAGVILVVLADAASKLFHARCRQPTQVGRRRTTRTSP
ncbi:MULTISPECIES: hypothetical protein [unclassified Kitasatospora]|uniref:hypothetical protein n=1 Tax=unclassified Kitasatospora TaxID=2633591 RepID=UPI002476370F|nr:hypothetical protein [Kitasatospora sp. MAP12-44]